MTIDFGRTAADYSCHRDGFPEAFFKRIEAKGIICAGTRVLDLAGNVVAATEALIMQHNPSWSLGGGNGFYPQWLRHLKDAAFVDLETFSFDLDVTYKHDAWRGRIRASAGVAASLDDAQVLAFDNDLKQLLLDAFPADPLEVPHRVFVVLGKTAARD